MLKDLSAPPHPTAAILTDAFFHLELNVSVCIPFRLDLEALGVQTLSPATSWLGGITVGCWAGYVLSTHLVKDQTNIHL